ncbi:unnamed protein product [Prorocentrum cordatum]|uniref:Uncharacterized protein n=1 Tax=Prorocentrum cordatum TaxID=2364126 RepID=A0ABN9SI16_9DINO|nr:unnamed protein product [Polarella glacialis]
MLIQCCLLRIVPFRLMSMQRSTSSSVSFQKGAPLWPTAALLMQSPMGPSSASARLTAATASSRLATSHGTASAPAPASRQTARSFSSERASAPSTPLRRSA